MRPHERQAIADYLTHWIAAQSARVVVATIAACVALWQGRGFAVAALAFLTLWIAFGFLVPRGGPEMAALRKRLDE